MVPVRPTTINRNRFAAKARFWLTFAEAQLHQLSDAEAVGGRRLIARLRAVLDVTEAVDDLAVSIAVLFGSAGASLTRSY